MGALRRSAAIMRAAILIGAFNLVIGAMILSGRLDAAAVIGVVTLVIGLGLVLFGLFVASARRMVVGLEVQETNENG